MAETKDAVETPLPLDNEMARSTSAIVHRESDTNTTLDTRRDGVPVPFYYPACNIEQWHARGIPTTRDEDAAPKKGRMKELWDFSH